MLAIFFKYEDSCSYLRTAYYGHGYPHVFTVVRVCLQYVGFLCEKIRKMFAAKLYTYTCLILYLVLYVQLNLIR